MRNVYSIIIAVCCLLTMVGTSKAESNFPSFGSGTLELGSGFYTLKANKNHNMNDYSPSSYHGAALKIKENCIVVVSLNGYTLTLTGQNATVSYEATPAIEIPESSTLIITGWSGKLVLRGGDGYQAENGKSGVDADFSCHNWQRGGKGGSGGRGGHGSAPAIGTWAGKGGAGGTSPDAATARKNANHVHTNSNADLVGGSGTSTKSMGKLIVLGQIDVTVNKGGVNTPFVSNTAALSKYALDEHSGIDPRYNYNCSAGGSGGQGGATIFAKFCIGAGAPGAGGGGAGGNGCILENLFCKDQEHHHGVGGLGGQSDTQKGGDGTRHTHQERSQKGQSGGKGGSQGSTGSHGMFYYTLPMKISSSYADNIYSPDNSKRLNDMSKGDVIKLLPKDVVGSITGATFSDGSTSYSYYNGMTMDNNLKVKIPTKPTPNSVFMGYWSTFGDKVFDKDGNLNIVVGKSPKFIKDARNNWYVATGAVNMPLEARWSNVISVVENHFVENEEPVDGKKFADTPLYSSRWSVVLEQGKTQTVVSKKFYDHDGKRIDALLTATEEKAAATARRFRIAAGEKEQVQVVLSKDSLVIINHYYERNEFDYALNYKGVLTDSEFSTLLTNADTYTKPGKQKYGRSIVRPVLRSLRGKYVKDWKPTDAYEIPVGGVTMTPVVTDTTYYITQNVEQNETESYIDVSKVSGVAYQENVTVTAHLVGQTCISEYAFTTTHTGKPVSVTALNDTTFSFKMPDDDVDVRFTFAKIHYNLMASAANNPAAKLAIRDRDGKMFTDDNDYFKFGKDVLGGQLKDFKVYQDVQFDVIAEIDQTKIPDQVTKEYRPVVEVHCGNKDVNEEGHTKSGYVAGKFRKYYNYNLENCDETVVKIMWTERIAKTITLGNISEARIDEIFTDVEGNIYDEQHGGGKACRDDVVFFSIKTNINGFDCENISISYTDAEGNKQYDMVDKVMDELTGKLHYCFIMPGRDVSILLNSGKKVKISGSLPTATRLMAGSGERRTVEYKLAINENAVEGSVVPYYIFNDDNTLKPLKHTTVLCNGGRDLAQEPAYKSLTRTIFGETFSFSYGQFVVPSTDVIIRNGYMLQPEMKGDWFGLYVDEDTDIPANVTAYNVVATEDGGFELRELKKSVLPANHPVVCKLSRMQIGPSDSNPHFFMSSDPNTITISDVRPVIRGTMDETTLKALKEKHGTDKCIMLLDFDRSRNSIFFRPVYDDELVLKANSVYMVKEGGSAPLYPVAAIADVMADSVPTVEYGIMGMQVDDSYKGIVIRNGKKYLKR